MNLTFKTTAGTAVFEPSEREYDAYLERRAQARQQMSVDEFKQAYREGRLDETDPAVSELVALLQIGQNSH